MADLNQEKLDEVKGKLFTYMGAHWLTHNLILGKDLGLFDAIESFGSKGCTIPEMAKKAEVKSERMLKEWALGLLSNGLLESRTEGGNDYFILLPEVAVYFKDDGGPHTGLFALLSSLPGTLSTKRVSMIMKEGTGFNWGDLPDELFPHVAKFFQPVYKFLLPYWIENAPELAGLKAALSADGSIALDVGCGFGISTRVIGGLFPKSKVMGVDYHAGSVEEAKKRTVEEGCKNVDFTCCSAESPDWHGSESASAVFFFDCFHDMTDPAGATKQAFAALKPGGFACLIEPLAADEPGISNALQVPVTPIFAPLSMHYCTPCGLGPDGKGAALGACVPTSVHRDYFVAAGFSSLQSVRLEGGMDPAANGFRLLLVTK